jgi:molecular chaperone DnaK
VEIQAGSGLSESEIKKMVSDAESHADDDRKARELAEAKNAGEQAIYQTERTLQDHEENLLSDDRSRLDGHISALREALAGDDADAIHRGASALQEAWHEISAGLYQRAEAQQPQGPNDGTSSEDEEIVDAEVVD